MDLILPGEAQWIESSTKYRVGGKSVATISRPDAINSNNFVGVFSAVRGVRLKGITPME